MRLLQPGDLLLIQADEVDETVAYVQNCLTDVGLGREVKTLQSVGPVPEPHVGPAAAQPRVALAVT